MDTMRRKTIEDEKKKMAEEYIAAMMKPTDAEAEYMMKFTAKEYKPELLFDDAAILERIKDHPMALWKCR